MNASQVDPAQAQHMAMAMIPFIGLFALLIIAILIVPLWVSFRKAGLPPALSLLALIPGIGTLIALYVLAFARWKVVPAPEFGAYPPYPPPGYAPLPGHGPEGYAPPPGYGSPSTGAAPQGYVPPGAPPTV